VTHEYTILTGGIVLTAVDGCAAPSAVAWALDTILAVGSDEAVLAISRGDSRVADLHGAVALPGPGLRTLEPGDQADLTIRDPRTGNVLAEVRAGLVVSGEIAGLGAPIEACVPES
jgi:hypothetical protein